MTVQLCPPIVFQSFLSTGAPNAFGTVATYIAGTTTPQATYIDSTQTTQNQNPTPLNALGQASIWLATNLVYKIVVFDSLGNQINFQDQIIGGTALTGQQLSIYGVDSGVVNAYIFTHTGPNAVTLTAGVQIRFTPLNTNTGAATINADGTGAVAVIGQQGGALTGGEMSSLGPVVLQYTGASWQIISTNGAQPGFQRTAAEVTAGIIPVQYFYLPGYIDRYGVNTTPGTTDMTTAITNAFLANVQVYGTPGGGPYRYNSNIALQRDLFFDLQGTVLKPANAQLFNNPIAADVQTSVTNALKGSLFVTVGSTAGLAVGNIVCLQGPNAPNGPIPFFWAQIKQIVSSVLTLDRALPIDYVSNTNSTGTLAWQINTAYKYGDFVTNAGNYYFCAIPGTSAGATGPTSTTPNTAIVDNGVTWVFWGNITCNLYNNSTTLRQRCIIRNGDVDGSLYTTNPASLGMFLRASLYRNVLLENLRFFNWNTTGTNQPDMIDVSFGIDCKMRGLTFDENVMNATGSSDGAHVDVQGFRSFTFENNTIMGSGFGCDGTACESFIASGNILNGTTQYEAYQGLAVFPLPVSARGIKGTRCMTVDFSHNSSVGYSTPLRTDQGIRAIWQGNAIRNADATSVVTFTASVGGATSGTLTAAVGNATYTTTFSDGEVRSVTITGGTAAAWSGALNAGTITTAWMQGVYVNSGNFAINGSSSYCPLQRGYIIKGNLVENVGGYAIAFHSGVGVFSGRNICVGNKISGCNGAGIYSTDSDAIIEGNHIENWDRAAAGLGGIHLIMSGHTIRNNRFRHDTDTTRWCISTLPTGGGQVFYVVEGNVIEGSNPTNPLIQGGFDVQAQGVTTIASGTTSNSITPNVISSSFTMDGTMVTVTPTTKTPTNTPRMASVGTFAANSFAVQVDSDPGAGGINVAWVARVRSPFKL